MSADEMLAGGNSRKDSLRIAETYARNGVDLLSVTAGSLATTRLKSEFSMGMWATQAPNLHLARAVKERVDVPVAQHEHQAWEDAAPIYAETVGFLTAESGQSEMLFKAVGIGEGDQVLDVGCGPGVLSRRLAEVANQMVRLASEPALPEGGMLGSCDLTPHPPARSKG